MPASLVDELVAEPALPVRRSRTQWSSAAADDQCPVDEKADYQRWLAAQPDDVKQAAIEIEFEEAKTALPDHEVAEALGMSDDEAEHALAEARVRITVNEYETALAVAAGRAPSTG